MTNNRSEIANPQEVQTRKPGTRVLRTRSHRPRLHILERGFGARVGGVFDFFSELVTQTPVLWMLAALTLLVILAPIPVWLLERGRDGADMTSYGIGLWWAVSAFSTAGHSDVVLITTAGRIVGSIYTVLSVSLFFGSVLAAFSSYFILTWRRPKRQLVDTINYYLQRIDELSIEEIEDLEDLTSGLLHTEKQRAEAEGRPPSVTSD